MSHFIEKCGTCGTIVSQCRCMALNKELRITTCEKCAGLVLPDSERERLLHGTWDVENDH